MTSHRKSESIRLSSSVAIDEEKTKINNIRKKIIEILKKHPLGRSPSQLAYLANATDNIKFFIDLIEETNDSEIHKQCCKHMMLESYPKGHQVIVINTIGDKFYIILSGSVSVHILKQMDDQSKTPLLQKVTVMGAGASFGEIALISNEPRLATVICDEDCDLLVLSKQSFDKILKSKNVMNKKLSMLQNLPFLEDVNKQSIREIFSRSEHQKFIKKQHVFLEGEEAKAMFIVTKGVFEATKKFYSLKSRENEITQKDIEEKEIQDIKFSDKRQEFKSMQIIIFKQGDYFGEEELIDNNKRCLTVICDSQEGEVIVIKKSLFIQKIMGDLKSKQKMFEYLMSKREILKNKLVQIQEQVDKFWSFLIEDRQSLKNNIQLAEEMRLRNLNSNSEESLYLSSSKQKINEIKVETLQSITKSDKYVKYTPSLLNLNTSKNDIASQRKSSHHIFSKEQNGVKVVADIPNEKNQKIQLEKKEEKSREQSQDDKFLTLSQQQAKLFQLFHNHHSQKNSNLNLTNRETGCSVDESRKTISSKIEQKIDLLGLDSRDIVASPYEQFKDFLKLGKQKVDLKLYDDERDEVKIKSSTFKAQQKDYLKEQRENNSLKIFHNLQYKLNRKYQKRINEDSLPKEGVPLISQIFPIQEQSKILLRRPQTSNSTHKKDTFLTCQIERPEYFSKGDPNQKQIITKYPFQRNSNSQPHSQNSQANEENIYPTIQIFNSPNFSYKPNTSQRKLTSQDSQKQNELNQSLQRQDTISMESSPTTLQYNEKDITPSSLTYLDFTFQEEKKKQLKNSNSLKEFHQLLSSQVSNKVNRIHSLHSTKNVGKNIYNLSIQNFRPLSSTPSNKKPSQNQQYSHQYIQTNSLKLENSKESSNQDFRPHLDQNDKQFMEDQSCQKNSTNSTTKNLQELPNVISTNTLMNSSQKSHQSLMSKDEKQAPYIVFEDPLEAENSSLQDKAPASLQDKINNHYTQRKSIKSIQSENQKDPYSKLENQNNPVQKDSFVKKKDSCLDVFFGLFPQSASNQYSARLSKFSTPNKISSIKSQASFTESPSISSSSLIQKISQKSVMKPFSVINQESPCKNVFFNSINANNFVKSSSIKRKVLLSPNRNQENSKIQLKNNQQKTDQISDLVVFSHNINTLSNKYELLARRKSKVMVDASISVQDQDQDQQIKLNTPQEQFSNLFNNASAFNESQDLNFIKKKQSLPHHNEIQQPFLIQVIQSPHFSVEKNYELTKQQLIQKGIRI